MFLRYVLFGSFQIIFKFNTRKKSKKEKKTVGWLEILFIANRQFRIDELLRLADVSLELERLRFVDPAYSMKNSMMHEDFSPSPHVSFVFDAFYYR